jgi:hypothetical protein
MQADAILVRATYGAYVIRDSVDEIALGVLEGRRKRPVEGRDAD